MTLPKKIQLRDDLFAQRGLDVPESAFRVGAFKFDPRPFSVGGPSSRMREKHYGKEIQEVSLQGFLDNPVRPYIYGVASQSNQEVSTMFAAYLAQEFLARSHSSNRAMWLRGHKLIRDQVIPDTVQLLVISGLTPNTPKFILDRVTNLIDQHDRMPIVVSITGEDPVTFFATSLYTKVHRVFFHTDNRVSREVEVV